ncbi:MAG: 16S rRNA (uracil(1498)-N(3))-methyltransferase [Actinobacteria bacterium]|nr:16S rRNA (uracil(1498)-N(3))-methyltransferase [Actinomycetota bacterium]
MFYADPEKIDLDSGCIYIEGDEARHIAKSIRAKAGELVFVGDGHGNRYETKLTSIDAINVVAEILSHETEEFERPSITIFQAVSKMKHMDETIVRAAESGAGKVLPFISQRSPVDSLKKSVSRQQRWKKIALESSKLSRRNWLLEIEEVGENLPDLKTLRANDLNIILWEEERTTGIMDLLPEEAPLSIGLIVGPEGGFSCKETEEYEELGAETAGMGGLVLRTESAASYAAMLIRSRYGNLDMGSSGS